jgi:hypothetical protein
MAAATTRHAWMVAHALRRAAGPSLDKATSLAFGRPDHTAWPEPSPDAPRHGSNHLMAAAATRHPAMAATI